MPILCALVLAVAMCPTPVTTAVEKKFPGAKVSSCKEEHEHGKTQYEVKLTTRDARALEVDVAPDGAILQIEEKIDAAAVPAAVMKAFAARYPSAKVTRAERQTQADGAVSYELAFASDQGRREVTFREDGTFVEEE